MGVIYIHPGKPAIALFHLNYSDADHGEQSGINLFADVPRRFLRRVPCLQLNATNGISQPIMSIISSEDATYG